MNPSRQPVMFAWQAACLLAKPTPPKKVEKALRETLLFWATYDGIDVPPLLRRSDVKAFEDAFVRQMQYHRWNRHGANTAALNAIRHIAWELGWVPF